MEISRIKNLTDGMPRRFSTPLGLFLSTLALVACTLPRVYVTGDDKQYSVTVYTGVCNLNPAPSSYPIPIKIRRIFNVTLETYPKFYIDIGSDANLCGPLSSY